MTTQKSKAEAEADAERPRTTHTWAPCRYGAGSNTWQSDYECSTCGAWTAGWASPERLAEQSCPGPEVKETHED